MKAISCALITSIAGGITALFLAPLAMKWHLVPDLDGASVLPIFFMWLPLSLLVGFFIGLVNGGGAGESRRTGKIHPVLSSFLQLQFVAVLSMGCAWFSKPPAPTIEGQLLNLDYEVKLPTTFPL